MQKRMIACLPLVLLFAAPAALAETPPACKEPPRPQLSRGTKLLAHIAGPNWGIATVDTVRGDAITAKYSDGGVGSMSPKEFAALPIPQAVPCFKAGDKVLVRGQGDIWHEGSIIMINGADATVVLLDKKREVRKVSELVRLP